MPPVCLIIRDGWGFNENPEGNAVAAASTPNMDHFKSHYPWTLLDAAGDPVGVPAGFQGSSEVGHLNIGAGRIVVQEIKRIDDGLLHGELFQRRKWVDFMRDWKAGHGRLHLFGLLQDEGVHAYQAHLFKIMRRARSENLSGEIIIHPFLDGRDTPPRSSLGYLEQLASVMDEVGKVRIGTVMGRYYAMDRSQNYKLTDQAMRCLVKAEGRPVSDAVSAVKISYAEDLTPDNASMADEYIPPCVLTGYDGIRDGDCVFHTNYRQDRAIQLTRAFVDPSYPGDQSIRPRVSYLGLTRYYNEFKNNLLEPIDEEGGLENLLGETISGAGLRQLRIAETQKFRHVTSFMNGKSTKPYPMGDQIEVKGRFDPSAFASHPEMEAYLLTDRLLEILKERPYPFMAVNYANCDMVGHTGDFKAAKKAVEVVDECVGKLVSRLLELGYHILITADHGNAEQMIEYATGEPKTSHTTYPVEIIYVAKDSKNRRLIQHGKLSDIAPTVLHLMGLDIPKEMTAEILISL